MVKSDFPTCLTVDIHTMDNKLQSALQLLVNIPRALHIWR